MAGDVEQVPPGADKEDDDNNADFNAGLTGTEPTATPAPPPGPTPAPTPEPTPAPTEAPKYVQVTEDDWKSLNERAAKIDEISATVEKRLDQAFGKVGGIERIVKELQTKTPEGVAVQLDEADFDELKNEFPEIAALQIKGLNKVLSKFKGTADPAEIEKAVNQRLEKIQGDLAESTLDVVFDGWKDEVKTPKFHAWMKDQAPDVKALAASANFTDAAKLLRLYEKAKNAAPTPAPAPTPSPTPAPPSARQRQIAAAVPPKGDGGTPPGPNEDDDFTAGLKYRSG